MAARRRCTISRSRNGKISARASTSVTCVPSAANMQAYSQPMTPPPSTVSDGGSVSMVRISSLSWMRSSAKSMSLGRCGFEPVAIENELRRHAPLARLGRDGDACGGSTKRPVPRTYSTRCLLEVAHERARFGGGDRALARHQVLQRGARVELDGDAVEIAGAIAGEVQRGLAQRLARQACPVCTAAPPGATSRSTTSTRFPK